MNTSIHDFVGPEALARVNGENGIASRLPTVAYTDPGFLALEYRRWLRRTWLLVGRGQDMPNPGDVAPVLGHPYFLARNGGGEIGAFHNVCRHRGHTLVEAPCNRRDTLVGCESRMAVMSAAWFVEFRQRLPWLLHVD